MMSATAVETTVATATRQRLIDAAIALFIRHSFAGTSLQMIADELGFTKAAIYHHFRTREQLLTAVLEPIINQLRDVVVAAEARLAVESPALVAVLAADPGVHGVLKANREWTELIDRQLGLLADVEPGPAGRVRARFVFAGMAGSGGPTRELDRDALHRNLVEAGRRTLGLRAPRRTVP